MTQGNMDRGVRSPVPLPAFLCVDCFFSRPESGVFCVKTTGVFTCCLFRMEEEEEPRGGRLLWLDKK